MVEKRLMSYSRYILSVGHFTPTFSVDHSTATSKTKYNYNHVIPHNNN